MNNNQIVNPDETFVQKTSEGYRVVRQSADNSYKPLTDKTYFHATSAYAAMGRLIHNSNLQLNGVEVDPSKKVKH